MSFQHLAALGCRVVPMTAEPGEGLHLPNGHAGFAQAQQESDPVQVRSRIAALAAGSARYGRDQPGALVVAQRVRGQTRAPRDLGDGQIGFHGNDRRSWSALEVKVLRSSLRRRTIGLPSFRAFR